MGGIIIKGAQVFSKLRGWNNVVWRVKFLREWIVFCLSRMFHFKPLLKRNTRVSALYFYFKSRGTIFLCSCDTTVKSLRKLVELVLGNSQIIQGDAGHRRSVGNLPQYAVDKAINAVWGATLYPGIDHGVMHVDRPSGPTNCRRLLSNQHQQRGEGPKNTRHALAKCSRKLQSITKFYSGMRCEPCF